MSFGLLRGQWEDLPGEGTARPGDLACWVPVDLPGHPGSASETPHLERCSLNIAGGLGGNFVGWVRLAAPARGTADGRAGGSGAE